MQTPAQIDNSAIDELQLNNANQTVRKSILHLSSQRYDNNKITKYAVKILSPKTALIYNNTAFWTVFCLSDNTTILFWIFYIL